MSIVEAKKEGIIRLIGNVLLLISFTISPFFFYEFLRAAIDLYIFFICILIGWFLFLVLIKLEIKLVRDNSKKLSFMVIAYTIIIIILGLFSPKEITIIMNWILIIVNCIFLLMCWHFSLSIYKRKKFIFLTCFLIVQVCYFIILLLGGTIYKHLILLLILMLLTITGTLSIIFAEMSMKKKELLNYI